MQQRNIMLDELALIIRQLLWQGNKQGITTMERLEITMPQAIVMLGIEANGDHATMSELARLSQLSAGTLTGIVDRLIEAGLVSRDRDEHDRRLVLVYLTDEGRKKIAHINAERRHDMEMLVQSFSDSELATFNHLLVRLLEAMGEDNKQ